MRSLRTGPKISLMDGQGYPLSCGASVGTLARKEGAVASRSTAKDEAKACELFVKMFVKSGEDGLDLMIISPLRPTTRTLRCQLTYIKLFLELKIICCPLQMPSVPA
jgi:hypothetical protein